MSKHLELRKLEQAERKAWRKMMNGSEVDACNEFGKEGVNSIAWAKAADACRAYRTEHKLLGLTWKQIESGMVDSSHD